MYNRNNTNLKSKLVLKYYAIGVTGYDEIRRNL